MATVAVKVVTEEIETVVSADGESETRFKTVTESLVDIPVENSENSLTKEYSSADSGICVNKDKSDTSVLTNDEDSEQENSPHNAQKTGKSLSQKSSKSEEGHSQNRTLSQESKASSRSSKSSVSSKSTSSRHTDDKSNSSYNSTLKGSKNIDNNDEDSRSSVSSSSTLKSSQPAIDKSDDESSRSNSFKSSAKSSPQKRSQKTNVTDDNDSRSSFASLKSKSTIKSSQPVRSDDESSRSSFKSSTKSSPQKRSQKSNVTDDNDSRSSFTSSKSKSTIKSSQPVRSDDEDSKSSNRSSSRNTSPQKQSQSSQSTIKDSQPVGDKSNDENSKSSFKSTSRKSSPQKQSQSTNKSSQDSPTKQSEKVEKPKKYFSIVDSDSEDDIVTTKKSRDNDRHSDSDSSVSKSVKSPKSSKKSKIKNNRKLIDSDSDEEPKSGKKSSEGSGSDSDDSGNKKENLKSNKKSNKISDLVDSESDDENDRRSVRNASSGEENDAKNSKVKKKSAKKTGTAKAFKEKAMQDIHSETQRLIRESNLSLPYHRPKQRTLQEFLNRKKVATAIPKNLTRAEKVKMFPEMISKAVQEKEKEAELFYKSSDSEEDEDYEPMDVDQMASEKESNETPNSNNVDTQADVQNNEKSENSAINPLLKSPDFVSRKLFDDDSNDSTDPKITEKCDANLEESNVLQKPSTTNEEDLTMDIGVSREPVTISEEKVPDENKEPSEKKLNHDNETEDMVLNMSETEHDTSEGKIQPDNNEKSSLTVDKNNENASASDSSKDASKLIESKDTEPPKDQTKDIDNLIEEISKSDEKRSKSAEESEDPILKLVLEPEEEEKTIDHNVLRDDFGLPLELEEPKKKKSLKEEILANALKIKPMIKSSPGSVIDLTGPGQLREGAKKLMDRFVRHSTVNKPKVETVSEVKILRMEGTGDDMQVIEEILPFNKTIVEDDPKKESKPGEKLKKLREDLKLKIANARDEEWKQRKEKEEEEEEEEDVGKGKCDDFYADLPDEEELLEDEESAESEPEEDDVPMVERKRKSCAFGDEEAEESDDDGDEAAGENDVDDDDEDDEENEEDEEEEDEEESEEEKEEEEDESMKKPKKLRRIIQPVDDDSNQSSSSANDTIAKLQTTLDRTKTDEDMFASQAFNLANEDTENDNFSFFQRDRLDSDSRSQACKTPLPKHQVLSMISPVAHLTALNTSLDSAMKSTSKTNNFDLGKISVENTPCENSNRPQNNCNMEKMINLQKKLFEDPPETVNDQELLEVCSGKFTDTQSSGVPALTSQNVTDSQLMSICSGAFATQSLDTKKLESSESLRNQASDSQIMAVCSGKFITQPFDAKKLESGNESQASRPSDSQIMDVLSGGFATQGVEAKKSVTDSQIMDVCSGGFTQAVDPKRLDVTLPTLQLNDETSQDVTLILEDDEDSKHSPTKTCSSVKRSDESMFSCDSKSPIKDPSFENGCFKNPMEAWLKKVTEKSQPNQKANDVTDSQIRDMCSGDFPSQSQVEKSKDVTDSQIRDMCSGDFPSQSQAVNNLLLNQNENSQDFNLTLDENTMSPVKESSADKKKAKNPMEAWLQKCNDKAAGGDAPKKQDDSKEVENEASSDLNLTLDEKTKSSVEESEVKSKKAKKVDEVESGFKIMSSSEDEEKPMAVKMKKKKKLKKKKAQKLELSDDEDEENANEFSDEEEEESAREEDDEKFIDYDSDENEVVVVSKKEIKKVAQKFVENEAELSESDWDSADEDEQDLDKFEAEEADAEEIDEDKMKDQLDRIHMKQVMDDDQRDVRMLQELLFDDGDLHSEGAGRERRFKWKNIDSLGNDQLGPRMDDNTDLMDDEVDPDHEAQMRKLRHEQQRFLEEKGKSADIIENDLSESQLFNCGLKVVTVRSSKTTTMTSTEESQKVTKSNSATTKSTTMFSSFTNLSKTSLTSSKSLSFSNTRGSFLSRGDATLVRIAQSLPESNKVSVNVRGKGKFVFEHLSPSVSKTAKADSENDDTPTKEKPDKTRKRKMFCSQGQTPKTTKKLKVDDRTAGKKLF